MSVISSSTPPENPNVGQIWFDRTYQRLMIFNGQDWVEPQESEDEIPEELQPEFRTLFDSVFLPSDRLFSGDE